MKIIILNLLMIFSISTSAFSQTEIEKNQSDSNTQNLKTLIEQRRTFLLLREEMTERFLEMSDKGLELKMPKAEKKYLRGEGSLLKKGIPVGLGLIVIWALMKNKKPGEGIPGKHKSDLLAILGGVLTGAGTAAVIDEMTDYSRNAKTVERWVMDYKSKTQDGDFDSAAEYLLEIIVDEASKTLDHPKTVALINQAIAENRTGNLCSGHKELCQLNAQLEHEIAEVFEKLCAVIIKNEDHRSFAQERGGRERRLYESLTVSR